MELPACEEDVLDPTLSNKEAEGEDDEFQRIIISQAVAGVRAELKDLRAEVCTEIASDLGQLFADMRAEIFSEVADTLADMAQRQADQFAALEDRISTTEKFAERADEDPKKIDGVGATDALVLKLGEAVEVLEGNFNSLLKNNAEQYDKMQQMDAYFQNQIEAVGSKMQDQRDAHVQSTQEQLQLLQLKMEAICSQVEGSFEQRLTEIEKLGRSTNMGTGADQNDESLKNIEKDVNDPIANVELESLRNEINNIWSTLSLNSEVTQERFESLATAMDTVRLENKEVVTKTADILNDMAQHASRFQALEQNFTTIEEVAQSAHEVASSATNMGAQRISDAVARFESSFNSLAAADTEQRGKLELEIDELSARLKDLPPTDLLVTQKCFESMHVEMKTICSEHARTMTEVANSHAAMVQYENQIAAVEQRLGAIEEVARAADVAAKQNDSMSSEKSPEHFDDMVTKLWCQVGELDVRLQNDVEELRSTLQNYALTNPDTTIAELHSVHAQIGAINEQQAKVDAGLAGVLVDAARQVDRIIAVESRICTVEEIAKSAHETALNTADESTKRNIECSFADTKTVQQLGETMADCRSKLDNLFSNCAEQRDKVTQMGTCLMGEVDELRSKLQDVQVANGYLQSLQEKPEIECSQHMDVATKLEDTLADSNQHANQIKDIEFRLHEIEKVAQSAYETASNVAEESAKQHAATVSLADAVTVQNLNEAFMTLGSNVDGLIASSAVHHDKVQQIELGYQQDIDDFSRKLEELASDIQQMNQGKHLEALQAQVKEECSQREQISLQVADRIAAFESRLSAAEDAATVQHIGEAVAMLGGNVDGLVKSIAEQREQVQEMGACLRSEIDGLYSTLQETKSADRWATEDCLQPLRQQLDEVAAQRTEIATEVTDALADVAQHADRVAAIERRLGVAEETLATADEIPIREPDDALQSRLEGLLKERLAATEEGLRSTQTTSAGFMEEVARQISQLESNVNGLFGRYEEQQHEQQQQEFNACVQGEIDDIRSKLENLMSADSQTSLVHSQSLHAHIEDMCSSRQEMELELTTAVKGLSEHAELFKGVERRLSAVENIAQSASATASLAKALDEVVAKIESDVDGLLARGIDQPSESQREQLEVLHAEVKAVYSQRTQIATQVADVLSELARHADRATEMEKRIATVEETAQVAHAYASGAMESTNGWASEVQQMGACFRGEIDELCMRLQEHLPADQDEISGNGAFTASKNTIECATDGKGCYADAVTVEQLSEAVAKLGNNVDGLIIINTEQRDQVQQMGVCFRGEIDDLRVRLEEQLAVAPPSLGTAGGASTTTESMPPLQAYQALQVQGLASKVAETIAELGKYADRVVEVEHRLAATEEEAKGAHEKASNAESTAGSTAANVLTDAQILQHLGEVVTKLEDEIEGLSKGSAETREEMQQMGTCFRVMTKRIGAWQAQVLQRVGESLARGGATNTLCHKKEEFDVAKIGSVECLETSLDGPTKASDKPEDSTENSTTESRAVNAMMDNSVEVQPVTMSSTDEAKQLRSDTPPPPVRMYAMQQQSWQKPMVAVTPPNFNAAQKVCGHAMSALALPSSPGGRVHEGPRLIPTPLAIHREQVAAGGISRLSASPGAVGPLHREPNIAATCRQQPQPPATLVKHHTPPANAVMQHTGPSAAPSDGAPASAQTACAQQGRHMPGPNPAAGNAASRVASRGAARCRMWL